MKSFLKAFFMVLTKPFWCSFSGLYQLIQLKKFERKAALSHAAKGSEDE
ncbi:hypothetical protein P8629_03890 [Hydrogenovibrio sp. 3SP14C1]|nr:hypothetical protein [Hydrogenovibrio sp. 3SP14C1]MDG4812138.1 hypothetical protein [Hydrogenovibrio sp. 3SP14C1]